MPTTFGEGRRVANLHPEKRRLLAEALEKKLASSFSTVGPVAPTSGPGALVLRSTVTDFAAPKVAVNWATTALIGPVSTGGIAVEFEAVDGASGEVIGIFRGTRTGNVLNLKNIKDPYSKVGHARSGVLSLAEEWHAYLTNARLREAGK